MLVDEPEGVAEFVQERAAIPARRADVELLHAADHADRGVAAIEAGLLVNHHVIRLRDAQREREIRKRRPLRHRIERRRAMRRAHVRIEGVIHDAARPFVDAGLRRAVRRRGAGELRAPELHRTDRHDHVAERDRGLALLHAGEDVIVRRDGGGVGFRIGKKSRAQTEHDEHWEKK